MSDGDKGKVTNREADDRQEDEGKGWVRVQISDPWSGLTQKAQGDEPWPGMDPAWLSV